MRLGSTPVDVNTLRDAMRDVDFEAGPSASRITLLARSALSATRGDQLARVLRTRLYEKGYSEFNVRFNPISNKVEILDAKDFERNLTEWAGEDRNQVSAADKIRQTYYFNASELDLSCSGLSSLPEALGDLVDLQNLNLFLNELETLPESIGNLVNLKELNVNSNCLSTIPASIGNLVALEMLEAEENKLETIPDSMGNLVRLIKLNLGDNQLQTIPTSFGSLVLLEWLILSLNRLETVPDSLGSLIRLKCLGLSDNQLRMISPSLGSLRDLRELHLGGNENLATLPLSLGQCRDLTWIDINDTGIPPELQDSILDICQTHRASAAADVLPSRINAWQTAAGQTFSATIKKDGKTQEIPLEGFIQSLEPGEKITINEWIDRLERTKDFSSNCQADLAKAVCGMLQTLSRNEEFKKDFFVQVPVNNEACGDRAGMAFNELYLAWKLAALPKAAPDKEKFDLMIRAAKTRALRDALAEQLSQHAKAVGHTEEESVQIYLYNEIALTKELNLLTAIRSMLYPTIGKRDWIDQKTLVKEVNSRYIDHLSDFTIVQERVSDHPEWKKIQEEFGERSLELIEKKEENKINEGEYLKQNNAMKKELEAAKKTFSKAWVESQLKTAHSTSPSPSSSSSSTKPHGKDEVAGS